MNIRLASDAIRHAEDSFDDMPAMLLSVRLRPTRQRIAIAKLLLTTGRRRFTAEILYDEAFKAGCQVSRATICSTLRQFQRAGLVKGVDTPKSRKIWFVSDRDALAEMRRVSADIFPKSRRSLRTKSEPNQP